LGGSSNKRHWWGWLAGSAVLWFVVALAIHLVAGLLLGPRWAQVVEPWDFASLPIGTYLQGAVLMTAAAALFVVMLRRLAHAPSSVWLGVAIASVVGLVASYADYAPGLWPAADFALEHGTAAVGSTLGALGALLLSDRSHARTEQARQPDTSCEARTGEGQARRLHARHWTERIWRHSSGG
jgi:hypothetical protein